MAGVGGWVGVGLGDGSVRRLRGDGTPRRVTRSDVTRRHVLSRKARGTGYRSHFFASTSHSMSHTFPHATHPGIPISSTFHVQQDTPLTTANALPIEGWTSDPNDEALLQSIPVLDSLRFVTDVRRILGIRGFN